MSEIFSQKYLLRLLNAKNLNNYSVFKYFLYIEVVFSGLAAIKFAVVIIILFMFLLDSSYTSVQGRMHKDRHERMSD